MDDWLDLDIISDYSTNPSFESAYFELTKDLLDQPDDDTNPSTPSGTEARHIGLPRTGEIIPYPCCEHITTSGNLQSSGSGAGLQSELEQPVITSALLDFISKNAIPGERVEDFVARFRVNYLSPQGTLQSWWLRYQNCYCQDFCKCI